MITQTATRTYGIDAAQSTAEFAVRFMTFATVRGRFRDFDGVIHLNEAQPERSWVEATIHTASIDTGIERRDQHLRSDDFFGSEAYPTMAFRSTSVEPMQDGRWLVRGDLTIRDVTRPVVLETALEGRSTDAMGRDRIGFRATTTLKRRQYGLGLNPILEGGGLVIGGAVKVTLSIQAIQKD